MQTSTMQWGCTEASSTLEDHLSSGRGGLVNVPGIGMGSGRHPPLVLPAYRLLICFPYVPAGWLWGAGQPGVGASGVIGAGAPAHAFTGVAAEPGTRTPPSLTAHFGG